MLRPMDVPVLENVKSNFDVLDLLPRGSRGAEIGVRRGRLSSRIIETISPCRYLMIDPWEHFPDERQPDPSNESQANMDAMYAKVFANFGGVTGVEVRRETSLAATKWVGINELDWVFVDGDHTPFGCFLDLVVWHQKVRPGGFILVHDYVEKDHFGIVQAVDEFLYRFPDVEVVGRSNELQYPTLVLRKSDFPQVNFEVKRTRINAPPVPSCDLLGPEAPKGLVGPVPSGGVRTLVVPNKILALSSEVCARTEGTDEPDALVAETGLAAQGRKKNVLHFCQVCWLGSVPIFITDIAKAFPEFNHIMVHLLDWRTDYKAMEFIRAQGVEVHHAPKVTKRVIASFNPVAVVYHNTPGKLFDGKWPYDWIKEWPSITYHHMRSWPLMPVDLDVFVSKFVFTGFEKCIRRAKKHIISPPCMDLRALSQIKRDYHRAQVTVGRLHTDHEDRHPQDIIDLFRKIQDLVPNVQFIDVGGGKYYKDESGKTWNDAPEVEGGAYKEFAGLKRVWMPPTGFWSVEQFMAAFDVLLLWNIDWFTDTWSRVVTEAMASGIPVVAENRGGPTEQITHEENGFLVDRDKPDLAARTVYTLYTDPPQRRRIGTAARAHATANYGLERLREDLRPFFFNAMIGAR